MAGPVTHILLALKMLDMGAIHQEPEAFIMGLPFRILER